MATNGLVSVVVGGKVAMKIVTGSDGYNAPKLAKRIRALGRVPSVEEATRLVERSGFGATIEYFEPAQYDYGSLVIQTPERDHYLAFPDEELSPLYREKFSDPRFNPRWKIGTAPYVEVVEFGAQGQGGEGKA